MEEIKNIIFDLGGVCININYFLTRDAFIKLGIKNFDEIYSQAKQNPVFDLFETGKIDEDAFFSELENQTNHQIKRTDAIVAWNAMLLDFPEENFKTLNEIKSQYRTFLFSNTNETHLEYYFSQIKNWYGLENMDSLFEKAYYSCRLGMRKPNVEAFVRVINENSLNPKETLFIDDSLQHVEGAKAAGLKAYHLNEVMSIAEVLKKLGL